MVSALECLLVDLNEIIYSCDANDSTIEKTFLQVGIQESDQDVICFLWFKHLTNLHVTDRILDVHWFCQVPFGIICRPFLLAGTIKYHLKQIGTSVTSQISNNIYVDNVMLGADSLEGICL